MDLFWDCSQIGGELKDLLSLKFVTYPTIVKLYTAIPYLKKIEKYINHIIHPLSSDNIMIFSQEIRNFVISRNTDKYCISIQKFWLFLLFFESFRVHLIKKVKILMMSAKSATLGLLKIKACRNKGYDAIISVHDVTNKTLS